MVKNKIKFGVSLYSFTKEYIKRELDFEECLAKAKDMGYKGIEIVAAQMVPEYPYPTEEWLMHFKELLEKYNLKPVCWSAYIDMGTRSDRDLTEDEIIQYTLNDLIYAKKVGFDLVRTQHAISPKIFKKMIKYCKDLDMKLAIEMHHPHHLRVPVWQEYLEIMEGEGKGYLGVVPDFSIFQKNPHKLIIKRALDLGFRNEKLQMVIEKHDNGAPLEETLKLNLTEIEEQITKEIYEMFNAPGKLEDLKVMFPHIFYIHGKFYHLEEGENDKCIPYDRIMPYLKKLGYSGYIACEYEGHGFSDTDAVEQLRRFVRMNKRILNT